MLCLLWNQKPGGEGRCVFFGFGFLLDFYFGCIVSSWAETRSFFATFRISLEKHGNHVFCTQSLNLLAPYLQNLVSTMWKKCVVRICMNVKICRNVVSIWCLPNALKHTCIRMFISHYIPQPTNRTNVAKATKGSHFRSKKLLVWGWRSKSQVPAISSWFQMGHHDLFGNLESSDVGPAKWQRRRSHDFGSCNNESKIIKARGQTASGYCSSLGRWAWLPEAKCQRNRFEEQEGPPAQLPVPRPWP